MTINPLMSESWSAEPWHTGAVAYLYLFTSDGANNRTSNPG